MRQAPTYGITRTGTPNLVWLRCSFEERERAKAIHGFRWNNDEKVWQWPIRNRDDEIRVVGALRRAFPNLQFDHAEIEIPPLPEPGPPLSSLVTPDLEYSWRRMPFLHQKEVVSALRLRDRVCVFYDMGTGKTQAAIEAACDALDRGDVQRIYIVCPAGLRGTWRREIRACAWVGSDSIAIVRGNPPKDHPDHLRACDDITYRKRMFERMATWTVLHYEAAVLEQDLLHEYCRDQFLIADEAHSLKNPRALRSQAVLNCKPLKAIMQTGTPVINSPVDAYTLADFCAPGLLGRSLYDFKDRYVITRLIKVDIVKNGRRVGKREVEVEQGYRNLEDVRRRLDAIGLRRRKHECLDLPPKIREGIYCEMTPKQQRAYQRATGSVADEVDRIIDEAGSYERANKSLILGQLVRLQQVASGFFPDPDNPTLLHWFDSDPKDEGSKFAAADEIVEEAVAGGRKVVIFSRFIPMVHRLHQRYLGRPDGQEAAVFLTGEVEMDEREERIRRFTEDPVCTVFVSGLDVGAFGLNLQVASVVIFFDRWWSPATNDQAEDRCHRSGQDETVNVYNLIAEGSIDEHVERVLERKREIIASAVGDQDDPDGLRRETLTRDMLQSILDYGKEQRGA